jgi:hypothetical protein
MEFQLDLGVNPGYRKEIVKKFTKVNTEIALYGLPNLTDLDEICLNCLTGLLRHSLFIINLLIALWILL